MRQNSLSSHIYQPVRLGRNAWTFNLPVARKLVFCHIMFVAVFGLVCGFVCLFFSFFKLVTWNDNRTYLGCED